jgi:hypothetical protein
MSISLVKTNVLKPPKATTESKKKMILELYKKGVQDVEKIAKATDTKPSYVGSVLQKEGLINNYFDLYTSTAHPMNVYSRFFRGKLGFKDVSTAEASVQTLEQAYRFFTNQHERAGQHHTLEMALTMLDRARWTGKIQEAEIYRRWLVSKLDQPLTEETVEQSQPVQLKLVA